ncbi:TIGR04076 family protein [Microbacterium sp. ZXX196]|uniref:TIGR04076 family protein n=1 Tax=Microbacterium sp. ZXX196 TaxID=2609291 RepID=UPI0012B71709|nr:TIGR04076 family protein [Microbacterium sp. ZXX196]MTE24241.1 TIGR04076 family protein [Microbacterium sp. ZXX196]
METQRVRCTLEEMAYSACGMEIGDHFEIGPEGITMPDGQPFCVFAVAAVVPLVKGRQGEDLEAWLESRPLLQCPDPPEAVRMRIEAAPARAEGGA